MMTHTRTVTRTQEARATYVRALAAPGGWETPQLLRVADQVARDEAEAQGSWLAEPLGVDQAVWALGTALAATINHARRCFDLHPFSEGIGPRWNASLQMEIQQGSGLPLMGPLYLIEDASRGRIRVIARAREDSPRLDTTRSRASWAQPVTHPLHQAVALDPDPPPRTWVLVVKSTTPGHWQVACGQIPCSELEELPADRPIRLYQAAELLRTPEPHLATVLQPDLWGPALHWGPVQAVAFVDPPFFLHLPAGWERRYLW
jgi:hypothetical protein